MRKITTLLFTLTFALMIGACERDGPAEEAGERVDEAIDSMRDSTEDAVDNIQESLEDACREADEKTRADLDC